MLTVPKAFDLALQVLECVVKNCGSDIHAEIATREFMDFMKDTAHVRSAHC